MRGPGPGGPGPAEGSGPDEVRHGSPDRVRRKLAAQEKELAATRDRERLRICGELITANLYRMERGMNRLTAENYYEDGCPPMDIPLDVRLGPQENAARYFKQYAKAKTAEKILTEQLGKGREELTYLESVVQELSQAEAEQDFNDIRAELESGGYLKNRGKKQPGFQRASKPRQFVSSAGLRILVGRSNRQNDRLTAKEADRRDIWLHTQKIHGSHVILCTGGQEPDEASLYEAACLAAYYSQGREAGKVPVDYTPVRYVKKARRGQAGHGGVHHLSDHAGRSGRPAGEEAGRKIKCEIKAQPPQAFCLRGLVFAYGVKGGTVLTRWAGTSR